MPTEIFVVELAVGGFIEPIGSRNAYTTSRLAVLRDGSTTPVLLLLADRKFGQSIPEDKFPFWADGDFHNEQLSNVELATKPTKPKAPRKSMYGVPSGTAEYMRLWREKNRDRLRASQRRFQQRRRSVLKKVQETPEILTAPQEDDPVLARLASLVSETSGDSVDEK